MRRRFFVERFDGDAAVVRGETAEHLGRVLRAEPGQHYELSDGHAVWLARVEGVRRDAITFALVEQLPAGEPALIITLLLSIIKFDRFEWCLEKATELSVTEIIPIAAARSEKALVAASEKRARRWGKILVESAQQSRRLRPPTLAAIAHPAAAFPSAKSSFNILLSENPEAPPIRTLFSRQSANQGGAGALHVVPARTKIEDRQAPSVVLAIGPEGGWTEVELKAALDSGFSEASLGQNILRAETAVIAALAVINYALGD